MSVSGSAGAASESSTPFVGRADELAELTADLDRVVSGQSLITVVAGDAGMGKTRLAGELAGRARERGMQVLWGRCHPADGAPPLWPWTQVFGQLLAEPTRRASVVGPDSAVLGAAFPAAVTTGASAEPLPPLGPGPARFRLFSVIAAALRRAAAEQPLLIVLDDLHWADRSSVLLLEFLADDVLDAPLMICVLVRRGEAAHEAALYDLSARPDAVRTILLDGLAAGDVADYLASAVGGPVDADITDAVWRRTDGNPFFLIEVGRLLATAGRGASMDLLLTELPHQVRAAVSWRLSRLTPPSREVLEVAAVAGRGFTADLVARAADQPQLNVLEALDEARDRRFVQSAGETGHYEFVHALVREALYDALPAVRRVQLHHAVAAALDGVPAYQDESILQRRAHHWYLAASGGDRDAIDAAVVAAERAADHAMRSLAYEAAVDWSRRAVELNGLRTVTPDDECEALLRLGDALNRAGDAAEARTTFLAAADIARSEGNGPCLARAALGYRFGVATGFDFSNSDEVQLRLLNDALELVGDSDHELRAALLSRLAMELYFTADLDRRVQLSDEAVAIARRSGDDRLTAETLVARHIALWSPHAVARQLADASETLRIAVERGDKELELQARYWRTADLLQLGDRATMDADIAKVRHLAAELRQPIYTWWDLFRRALVDLLEGRLAAAEETALRAVELGAPIKPNNAMQIAAAQLLTIRWEQGRLGELEVPVAEQVQRHPGETMWRCAQAFVQCGDDPEGARATLREVVDGDVATSVPANFLWSITLGLLCEIAVMIEDADAAKRLLPVVEPFAGRWIAAGPAASCMGPVSRQLGLLELVCGDIPAAVGHLERALIAARAMRTPPWVAHGELDLARALLARGTDADVARARELLAAADSAASSMGMVAVAEQARALSRR